MAFEINAVEHCNLGCVACSHASPVADAAFADPEAVRADLAALATAVSVRELRVVGGEPLLHPELPALLRAIRDTGIGERVRVTTNGTLLHSVPPEWADLVDEVFVSVYPGAVVRTEALEELTRRCAGRGVPVVVRTYDKFRLTRPAAPLSDADAQAVFDTCQNAHAWSAHTVQDGYVYLCPVPEAPSAGPDDRCPIHPVEGLAERLQAFLSRKKPLSTCRTCLGTVGTLVPHRQGGRKTWAALSGGGAVDWAQVERLRAEPFTDLDCYTDRLPDGLEAPSGVK